MRKTQLRRKSSMPRSRTPIRHRNAERASKEYARTYGSVERVLWVQSWPCCAMHFPGHVCGGRVENAHAKGDGMGRKSHHANIAPLCRAAHAAYDTHKAPFDIEANRDYVKAFAAHVHAIWTAHEGGQAA